MATFIPEIERATVTILSRVSPFHPVLRAWVRRLAADPDYQAMLDEFPVDIDLQEACEQRGYRWSGGPIESLADLVLKHETYSLVATADVPEHPGTPYAETLTDLAARFDEAIYRLALALAFYRRQGRPSCEFPPQFRELAGPFGLITTSLGAALERYADTLADLAWMARDDWYYRRED